MQGEHEPCTLENMTINTDQCPGLQFIGKLLSANDAAQRETVGDALKKHEHDP